jgi:hypothetical protein
MNKAEQELCEVLNIDIIELQKELYPTTTASKSPFWSPGVVYVSEGAK